MTRAAVIALLLLPSIVLAEPTRLPNGQPVDVGMDGDRLARIEGIADEAIKAKQCPGVVVVVVRQGKVVYRKAFGRRAVEPKAEDMTVDTIFDLASLTKPVATASSIHLLVDAGKLQLNDSVSKHLPALAKHDKVTVEHLLLHTSGLPAGTPVGDYGKGREKAIENIGNLKLAAEPGKKFTYSDVGYILLGEMVEKLSGQPLEVYVRKNLFDPLRVELTYRPDKEVLARCAPTTKENEWLRGVVHDPRARVLGGVAGHAGLFGTADDLAVFAQMLLDGGKVGEKRIMSEAAVKRYTDPHDVPGGKRTLGFDARTSYSSNRGDKFGGYGHTGFTGTSLWIDPPSQTIVIVLSNRIHPEGKGDLRQLRSRVASVAADAIVKEPFPAK